jgi:hypothetical protein
MRSWRCAKWNAGTASAFVMVKWHYVSTANSMRQSSWEASGFSTIQEIFLHLMEPENSSRCLQERRTCPCSGFILTPRIGERGWRVSPLPPLRWVCRNKYPHVSGTCAAEFSVLKHSGNGVYHLLLTLKISAFCSYSLFTCFVWSVRYTAIEFRNRFRLIDWSVWCAERYKPRGTLRSS